MKTKLLLPTLVLTLLAGAYLWQAHAQSDPGKNPAPATPGETSPAPARRTVVPPTGASSGGGYEYKILTVPLPRRAADALQPTTVGLPEEYAQWEMVHAELLQGNYTAGPSFGTTPASWPSMVYTLRKPR